MVASRAKTRRARPRALALGPSAFALWTKASIAASADRDASGESAEPGAREILLVGHGA
jgi:hypothetical protein